jgi:transcriptional regulator with XRE-family HTH domain
MEITFKVAIVESGLKQHYIAKQAGMHPVRLSKIIHQYVSPSEEEMARLAAVLNRAVSELFSSEAKCES